MVMKFCGWIDLIKAECSAFFFFSNYTPVEDGMYYVITRAGGWAVGVPHSLSGAYLQDYASYGYETSWVDRSDQEGVQGTGTIILEFCLEHISKTVLAMVMKFCGWIDLIKAECSLLFF